MSFNATRRHILKAAAAVTSGFAVWQSDTSRFLASENGGLLETETPANSESTGFEILMPRDRVPLSFIIDDSTCLVNMGHFCTPQFATCYPDRAEYQKDWKAWPREIPDSFVREFGEWCASAGVKGKYSIVPNPACVGWLDRELPGWSRKELLHSIDLVRDLMLPNWDIHPEMITHTRVIDLKTGKPLEAITTATMENSYPQTDISVDYLAEYLAYALRILKNCGLPCEGVTTPGGFGNRVKDKLPIAVGQAVRDVFPEVEIPHYFKYVVLDNDQTEPRLEAVSGLGTERPEMTVNVPAGTGDWFGGWQGDIDSQPDKYANQEATSGRMIDLIENRKPAIMLCHWPGIYSNGTKEGFYSFQQVITAINDRFANETQWMKISEIGRYWAVKQTVKISQTEDGVQIESPFACSQFTISVPNFKSGTIRYHTAENVQPLSVASNKRELRENSVWHSDNRSILCLALTAGSSRLERSA